MDLEDKTEEQVVDALLNKGVEFKVEKKGLISLFSKTKRTRNFIIQQPYLGTLYALTGLYFKAQFKEDEFKEDPLGASRTLARRSAKIMCEVVAVAVLNNEIKIKLFSKILARYFFWRLKPDTLLQIILIIASLNNTLDFTNSIRLIQVLKTTTPRNQVSPDDNGG